MKVLALVKDLIIRDHARILPKTISGYTILRPSSLPEWPQIKAELQKLNEVNPEGFVLGISTEFRGNDKPKAFQELGQVVAGLRLVKPNRGIIKYLIPLEDIRPEEFLVYSYPLKPWHVYEEGIITERDLGLFDEILPRIKDMYAVSNYTPRIRNAFDLFEHIRLIHTYSDVILTLVAGLESIFTTSNQEVAQLLSIRGAWFIHQAQRNFYEREKLFGQLKKMYDIRSTIIHGGDLSKFTPTEQSESLNTALVVARIILIKILKDEILFEKFMNKNPEGLNQYFNQLIFGRTLAYSPAENLALTVALQKRLHSIERQEALKRASLDKD